MPVGALVVGQLQVTRGTVARARVAFGRGRRILEVTFVDDDGAELGARWFHFRGGMQQRFAVGARFLISGVVRDRKGAREMIHPETHRRAHDGESATPGVRVRYPEVEGVPGRTVEKLCACRRRALRRRGARRRAARDRRAARARLAGDGAARAAPAARESAARGRCARSTTASRRRSGAWCSTSSSFCSSGWRGVAAAARREAGLALPAAKTPERALKRFVAALPFAPTGAQKRAIAEIARDLAEPHPMHRLLQGDVGSGKTVVAFAACELAVASGFQAAIMAPTEILAEQHARTLDRLGRERPAARSRC